jgi:enamine deaminase RidA (YjgF/YER057c/UK114 family)
MIEERLKDLGLALPPAPAAVGSYVPCVRAGPLAFVSGQLPFADGKLKYEGRVDTEVSLEEARDAARICTLNGLAALKAEVGDLELVERVVRVNGYVASAKSFLRHPAVLNAASDLLVELFGERGPHTRIAVGVRQLPMGASVEIDFIFALREEQP